MHWPAFQHWSFDYLADICESSVSEAPVKFTEGLVEQGVTKGRPFLPGAPYLRALGRAALHAPDRAAGLLPYARLEEIRQQPGARFHLNCAHMQSFKPTTLYLAQWDILEKFPALRKALLIKSLWPDSVSKSFLSRRRAAGSSVARQGETTTTGMIWKWNDKLREDAASVPAGLEA